MIITEYQGGASQLSRNTEENQATGHRGDLITVANPAEDQGSVSVFSIF
jgi:hypothetical protein